MVAAETSPKPLYTLYLILKVTEHTILPPLPSL